MSMNVPVIQRAYVWRRVHSLFGLWIVLFLIEHLFTNSQAALFFGNSGMGFVRAVNFIKGLPYLQVVESTLIGIPILFHAGLGIKYLLTAKANSFGGDGSKPSLPQYHRNKAYTWQRITSWILLIGIFAHVAYMRFYRYPVSLNRGEYSAYFTRVNLDLGLYTVADRLGVALYDGEMIEEAKRKLELKKIEMRRIVDEAIEIEGEGSRKTIPYSPKDADVLSQMQSLAFEEEWVDALQKKSLSKGQVIAACKEFGIATLLNVRDSFKSIFIGFLYTIFVLAAVFHAFNGLWTFLITWGIIIKMRSQAKAVNICVGIMVFVALLGLSSIWGTYWINLRN